MVVVVGGAVVAVDATVWAAGLVAERSSLDEEESPRRAVECNPQPAALMIATPKPTVMAIVRRRPILATHREIGEDPEHLETHSTV